MSLCDPMNRSPPGSSVHGSSKAKKYCSGLTFPPPGDLPDWGIEPKSPALAGGFFTTEPPEDYQTNWYTSYKTLFRLYALGCILLVITVFKGFFFNHTSNYCDNIDLERSTSMKFLLIHPCYRVLLLQNPIPFDFLHGKTNSLYNGFLYFIFSFHLISQTPN